MPLRRTLVYASQMGDCWEMVYQRYQPWRTEGRWQRIAAALGLEVRDVAP